MLVSYLTTARAVLTVRLEYLNHSLAQNWVNPDYYSSQ